jgi:hypothetical protein
MMRPDLTVRLYHPSPRPFPICTRRLSTSDADRIYAHRRPSRTREPRNPVPEKLSRMSDQHDRAIESHRLRRTDPDAPRMTHRHHQRPIRPLGLHHNRLPTHHRPLTIEPAAKQNTGPGSPTYHANCCGPPPVKAARNATTIRGRFSIPDAIIGLSTWVVMLRSPFVRGRVTACGYRVSSKNTLMTASVRSLSASQMGIGI